jgi:hypothetical protein
MGALLSRDDERPERTPTVRQLELDRSIVVEWLMNALVYFTRAESFPVMCCRTGHDTTLRARKRRVYIGSTLFVL